MGQTNSVRVHEEHGILKTSGSAAFRFSQGEVSGNLPAKVTMQDIMGNKCE